jgi:hypothetical protein
MLSLDKPAVRAGGLLVWTDHADAGQFYYAAPDPSIATAAGRPMYELFEYAVALEHSPLSGTTIPDELGAGFLTMGVDCRLNDATRAKAVRELADLAGRDPAAVSLAPIPYTSGAVSVIALDAATGTAAAGAAAVTVPGRPQLVRNVVAGGPPALLGDLRSIFSVSLSQDGVAFLEGILADGATPVGVVYDLRFLGLRPSVEAVVHADVTRVYEEFGGGLSAGCVYFRAEVDAALTSLRQKGAIDVRLTTQATGEEAAKAEELAMSLFKDRIVTELFQPAPTPPNLSLPGLPGMSSGQSGQSSQPSLVTLSLRYKKSDELRTVDYDFSLRAPEERTHAPQAFLTTLLPAAELAEHVHHVDLAAPFFELLEVLVTGPDEEELAALALRRVTARLTYGTDADGVLPETEDLVFQPGSTGDKTFAVKRRGRRSLGYTVELIYEFDRDEHVAGDARTYTTGPRPQTARALLVRPWDDLSVLDVEVEVGRVPADVGSVDVVLDAHGVDGFAASRTLRLPVRTSAPRDERRWQVRSRAGLVSYRAAPTLVFDDGATLALPPVESAEPLFRVDAPFTATRSLLVQPNVTDAAVTSVTVEVDYEDGELGYRRSFRRTLVPPTPDPNLPGAPATWPSFTLAWPVVSADRRRVRYRVTTTVGGVTTPGDWDETDDPSIVVGDVGHLNRHLDVRLVGPSMDQAGLDAVIVQVAVSGADEATATSLFFDPTSPSAQSVDLRAQPGAPPGFRYRTTSLRSDGTRRESLWVDCPTPLLVLSTRVV